MQNPSERLQWAQQQEHHGEQGHRRKQNQAVPVNAPQVLWHSLKARVTLLTLLIFRRTCKKRWKRRPPTMHGAMLTSLKLVLYKASNP